MYSVRVRIDGIETRRRSAGLLHIVIGFFLLSTGANYYRYLEYQTIIPSLPVFTVAAVSLLYGFSRKRIDLQARYNYWLRLMQVLTFTITGVVFLAIARPVDYWGLFVFALLTILLLFSERRIFFETVIKFEETGLRIPGYYRDHQVPWKSLSEVIVREDFLTIFHIKKKYLQYQVLQDLSTLEVTKMNAFCREKTTQTEQG
jgi:mRNA-degrading endonuclease YafQ of YafQ-DinJ toxin-antitoxin module